MTMMEAENIVQYYTRVKEVVNVICGANEETKDETIIRKELKTLLPKFH